MNGVHSGWNSLENYVPAPRRLAADQRKKPAVRGFTKAGQMSPFEQAGQNVRTGEKFPTPVPGKGILLISSARP